MSQQVSHRLPLPHAVIKQSKQLPVTGLVQLSELLDRKYTLCHVVTGSIFTVTTTASR